MSVSGSSGESGRRATNGRFWFGTRDGRSCRTVMRGQVSVRHRSSAGQKRTSLKHLKTRKSGEGEVNDPSRLFPSFSNEEHTISPVGDPSPPMYSILECGLSGVPSSLTLLCAGPPSDARGRFGPLGSTDFRARGLGAGLENLKSEKRSATSSEGVGTRGNRRRN